MLDERLRLSTPTGLQVLGRLSGNERADTIVVFSHGFGVKSDSRGMFNKLSEMLENDTLTVRFHYVTIDDFTQDTYVTSYSDQVEKLTTVVEKITTRFPGKRLVLISHSRGCMISSMYIQTGAIIPKLHIMLAPPPSSDVANKMRTKIQAREGSVLDEEGISVLSRSDGSKTMILPTFWKDAENVNPNKLFETASKSVPTIVIWGTLDTTVESAKYAEIKQLPLKKLYELPNGHEFMEDEMKGVCRIVKSELTK